MWKGIQSESIHPVFGVNGSYDVICHPVTSEPYADVFSALQSRARQEDPEQLRLKQKAKEVGPERARGRRHVAPCVYMSF